MSTKEKQMDMMSSMISDLVMLGATRPMVKRLIEYSADVIDLYKGGDALLPNQILTYGEVNKNG